MQEDTAGCSQGSTTLEMGKACFNKGMHSLHISVSYEIMLGLNGIRTDILVLWESFRF